jgi:ABC-type antimicrobial peptide transport system permease subunit
MLDTLASAWQSVTRHRLRSLLAMAGVAVGVCALTSIMSVEKSWRQAVTDFFAPMDLETVRVALPAGGNWRERGFKKPTLDRDDLAAIAALRPLVDSVTLMTWTTMRAETDDNSALELAVRAVEADFTKTVPDEVKQGRLFTAEEAAGHAPVCLLSFEACVWLFGDQPAVGRYVRLEGHRFQVVGVIAGNRHAGIGTRAIYVPSSWARGLLRSRYGIEPQTEVFVHTGDPQAASTQIEKLMRRRVGGDASRPFTHSLWQVRQAALNARNRATLYSGLAGLCALLAAGIGIASLLFVSVAERSREIGVHRALGASRFHVYAEYLLASVMLSAGGAVIGAVVGIPAAAAGAFTSRWQPVLDPLAGEMLTAGVRELPKLSEIALAVSWDAIAIAVALALLTGATAALAPASEAAAVDPAAAISQRPGTRRGLRKLLTCLQVGFGVLVLVVLTSYFSVLESQEKAEARDLLGQDRVSAIADPIAALRKPVERKYLDGCKDALAGIAASPAKLEDLRRRTPLLTALTPVAPLTLTLGAGGQTSKDVQVLLTTAEAFRYKPELAGDQLAQIERAFRAGKAVVVLNPEVKEALFGTASAIGKPVAVGGSSFAVIAVRPNPPGMSGMSEAWLPIGFYQVLKHRVSPGWVLDLMSEARIDARPVDERRYAEAMAQLRDALLPMLPEQYRKGIKFSEQIPETTKQFIFQHKAVAVRGAVGALAVLLVALIGLTNMLLVSVHQEVRETGVRRALGAQRSHVALHFLSEGVLLSMIGSASGLAAGALVCWATRTWANLPVSVSAFWAVVGAVATVFAGTAISLLPAAAAARMPPVEALRYE